MLATSQGIARVTHNPASRVCRRPALGDEPGAGSWTLASWAAYLKAADEDLLRRWLDDDVPTDRQLL